MTTLPELPEISMRLAYKKGYEHIVVEDYVFWSAIKLTKPIKWGIRGECEAFPVIDGSIWIAHAPYAWNGCNVLKDTSANMRPGLEHDMKCQAMRLGLIPPESESIANREFGERYDKDGGWGWFTSGAHRVLNWLGRNATRPHSEPQIFYAP